MTERPYPTSLAELTDWQRRCRTTPAEARLRFMQFVVLDSIAGSGLAAGLAFKGGNALRFVFRSRRSTLDLDFSGAAGFPDDADQIRNALDQALRGRWPQFGVRCRCQAVKRNPKNPAATLPTYQITIGFAFPGDRRFPDFETNPAPVSVVVELEISLNDLVCETTESRLSDASPGPIRVCTLADIVAEKLRSLLQQPVRNRNRRQDVLDIATVLADPADRLDEFKVAAFLVAKSQARGIHATRSAFDADIRVRAMVEYDRLRADAGEAFIPFDQAWAAVLDLVNRLDIPG